MNDKLFELFNSDNKLLNEAYNDMSKYQKEIFDKFKNDKNSLNNYSLNELIFDFDKNFIETILNIEINAYLEDCANNNIYNKKNGFTNDIDLTIGENKIKFNRPRLRNETSFDSIFIPKRTRIIKDLSENIILLYSKNNSLNDIKDILKGMFNIDVSTAFISNITQKLYSDVFKWRNRNIDKCYFTLNIDCTYISIKDQKYLNSHKIPIYIIVGTSLSGHKEILGIYLGNEDENKNVINNLYNKNVSENTLFWSNVFTDLKERGLEKVLYIISDGLPGIESVIKNEFKDAFYQRCVVHLVRNLKSYTNKKNQKQVLSDFKNIYTAPSKEIAIAFKSYFLDKYKYDKTLIKHSLEYLSYIMPLFDLPINIRKYIYTNNIVESVNSKVKRGFYGRGALPNINSAINIIYLNLIDLENKWKKSKVANWSNIYNEIIKVHKDDIKDYLN